MLISLARLKDLFVIIYDLLLDLSNLDDYGNLWIEGKISNYDYLMHLNQAAM